MSRKSVGRPRDADINRSILDAAIRLLGRHGFARLSLDMVAQEAGTTRPAIYRRYANKERLVVAAMEHIRGPLQVSSTGDLRTDLTSELRAYQKSIKLPSAIAMLGTVLAEEIHHPELLALYRKQMAWPRRERIKAVLRRIPDIARPTKDQDRALDEIVNMAIGSYYAHYVQGGHPEADWPERTADMLISGILRYGRSGEETTPEAARSPGKRAAKATTSRSKPRGRPKS